MIAWVEPLSGSTFGHKIIDGVLINLSSGKNNASIV